MQIWVCIWNAGSVIIKLDEWGLPLLSHSRCHSERALLTLLQVQSPQKLIFPSLQAQTASVPPAIKDIPGFTLLNVVLSI